MIAMDVLLYTKPMSVECMDRTEQRWVSVYIDNKALISRIKNWKHRWPSETLLPDYDLIQAAMNLSKKHRLDLKVYHVKSHQDDGMEYSDLPWWEAKLNVDCDALLAASVQTCTKCNNNKTITYRLPPGHWATLLLNQTWITSHLPTAIKEASYRTDLEECIMKCAGWDSSKIFDMVDWEAKARAGRRSRVNNGQQFSNLNLTYLQQWRDEDNLRNWTMADAHGVENLTKILTTLSDAHTIIRKESRFGKNWWLHFEESLLALKWLTPSTKDFKNG